MDSFLCPLSLQSTFLFSLVWSVGATCDHDGHEKFSEFFRELISGELVRELSSGELEEHKTPPTVGKVECPIPPEGLVYDYLFEVRGLARVSCRGAGISHLNL